MYQKPINKLSIVKKIHTICCGSRSLLNLSLLLTFLLTLVSLNSVDAQPPSHDPSTMVQNNDGRYFIFTTGDGIWNMSASNTNFTDWQPEDPVFPIGTYPGWIDNYVTNFNGFFWAPDVIKIGGTYFLYYSCAGDGAAAAIGLATAPDLTGPWTDQGMVVAGDNAIDPALYMDNGNLWMTWGNWQSGIDIVQLSTSTGKPISGSTHLVSGQVEGPGLIKNGCYNYLFYQRGLCCDGLNSSYYMVVARSTSITGPYTDERTFLPNRSGNEHGPGHFGYGQGKLTYHYYDVNDNGNAKLAIKTLGWNNGWPVANGAGGWESCSSGGGDDDGSFNGSVVQIRNRGTGLVIDGYGFTSNGDVCNQYSSSTTHPNSQWEMIDAGDSYYYFENEGTGMRLDGMGRTSNGADVGQWSNTTHVNAQWSVQQYDGAYYRIQNRGTGLYLDGMGRTSNGDPVGQYANTTHPNAQWELVSMNSAQVENSLTKGNADISVYPSPANQVLNLEVSNNLEQTVQVSIINHIGQRVMEINQVSNGMNTIDVSSLESGIYFAEIKYGEEIVMKKFTKQ